MMKTTAQGRTAEAAVAQFLVASGYKLLDRNWRTRLCEIDVIAKKDNVVFLVEVKYRAQDAQGSGLDSITLKKLNQMRFAAELWVQAHDWGGDWRLAVASVSGPKAENIDFLEL